MIPGGELDRDPHRHRAFQVGAIDNDLAVRGSPALELAVLRLRTRLRQRDRARNMASVVRSLRPGIYEDDLRFLEEGTDLIPGYPGRCWIIPKFKALPFRVATRHQPDIGITDFLHQDVRQL